MMAMQEECRLEMMKFYIQSQNPGLFEEVYHGVSYPDEQLAKQQNDQPQQQQQQSSFSHPAVETQSFSLANPISLKDLIANDLNINATEFDPLSLASLSLKDQIFNKAATLFIHFTFKSFVGAKILLVPIIDITLIK